MNEAKCFWRQNSQPLLHQFWIVSYKSSNLITKLIPLKVPSWEIQMDIMPRLEFNLISFYLAYPGRQIHWDLAHSLHCRHIPQPEPSTPLQHCSACEGVCLPAFYCGAHMFRWRALRQLAPPLRELPDRMLSRGLWLDIAGRRQTHPWGKHKLHCRRWPGQI